MNRRFDFAILSSLIATLMLSATVPAGATGWLLTGDYSQFGRLRAHSESPPWSTGADLATTPGDAIGREHGGLLYVVGRGGASLLQIYDPQAGMALVREFSLGAGRNPQDIAFDTQGRAFVSCYDQAVLLRVDVNTGAVVQTYSTLAFADADGLPETAWMLARGDRLFIACQKLDRWNSYAPTGPGALLVFDMAIGQWVDVNPSLAGTQPIVLAGGNPYTRIEAVGVDGVERLRVGCFGFYGLLDGGIDEIDPSALTSLGWVVTESQLGGDLSAFVSAGAGNVYAIAADVMTGDTHLKRWRQTGGVTLVRPGNGFVFADLAWDGGCQLFLADRTPAADGLRVYDSCTGLPLNTTPVPTGLPPFSFVLEADPVAAPVAPVPSAYLLRMAPPYPNPCNPAARLRIDGARGQTVRVTVTDLAGRAVSDRTVALDADGQGEIVFDGRDARGRALAAGVYLVTARAPGLAASRAVTLLK